MRDILGLLVRRRRKGRPTTKHPKHPAQIPVEVPQTDAVFLVLRRMRAPLVFIILVFAISVLGLAIIPGKDEAGNPTHMSVFDAFYFVTYTAATIGYGELQPFTTQQRLWVEACIFMTVIGWAYVIGTLLTLLQSSAFQNAWATQRFRTKVRRIHEPFLIICGYGQAGRQVGRALDSVGRRFVVIDHDSSSVEGIMTDSLHAEVPALTADASLPSTLGLAGLSHPHCDGVLALTDSDVDNLAIVMATSVLRPDLNVIARCGDRAVEERMRDFAPNSVINPSDRYGAYLVLAIQRPNTYRLVSWLMDPSDTPLPPENEAQPLGTWVVAAEDPFAAELSADLRHAGIEVEFVDPDDGNPDLSHAVGFVAGTGNDTTNLALAEHARLDSPDVFVAVRQQSDTRSALIRALDINSVFTPTNLIAQETLARVVTPLFWGFVEYAGRQDEEFSERVLASLQRHNGARGKDRAVLDLSERSSPALARWLRSRELTLADVMRDPDDRDEHLGLTPLVLIRDGEHRYFPDESTQLALGDQLLLVGTPSALDALGEIRYSDAATHYVVQGERVPETWLWRRLSRKHHQAP